MNYLTDYTIAGNEPWRLACLFLSLLVAAICGKITMEVFRRKGTRMQETDRLRLAGLVLVALSKPAVPLFVILGVWGGFQFLLIPEALRDMVNTVMRILLSIGAGLAVYSLVDVADFYITRFTSRTHTKLDDMLAPLFRKTLRVTVVIVVLLFIAENLSDKPIGTLLACLGVGGLAVALAAQDTIRNFFGALVVMADRPFQIGERVVIDGEDGVVEEVGFRSTKIRTLDGHLVTLPNANVASKAIRNIGARPFVKRVATIGITYDTPPEKVERAVEIIKEILADHEGMRPERPPLVFFSDFGDSSLNILVIYWYHPADYLRYLAFSHRVNLEILRRFNEEGIDFAFPSQTVYLAGDAKRELAVRVLDGRAGERR